jgi:hypothetical protein
MIVGTVHQEAEYSWQDACDAWAAQDGETEAGVHQVGVSGMETGQREKDQCKKVREANQGDEQPEMEGLLVEGEEREDVLELLMREVPLSQHASVHPTKVEIATLKGKRKRNLGKKLCKRLKLAKGTAIKEPRKEGKVNIAGGGENQVTSNLPRNPEVKGRGLAGRERDRGNQPAASPPTSRGECSG